jgi:hypothetical protein
MARDRQIWWAFFVSIGIVCPGALSGCLRSSNLRASGSPGAGAPSDVQQDSLETAPPAPAAAPTLGQVQVQPQPQGQVYPSPSASVAALPTPPIITPRQDPSQPASMAMPVISASASGEVPDPSVAKKPEVQAALDQPAGAGDPATSSATPLLDAAAERASLLRMLEPGARGVKEATPMLDAAAERIAAVTRQHQQSLAAAEPPADPPKRSPPTPTAVYRPSPDTAKSTPRVAPVVSQPSDPVPPPPPPPAPIGSSSESLLPTPIDAKQDLSVPDPSPAATDPEPAERNTVEDEPLTISEPQLCRKVHGFGSFDPLGDRSVKPGQRLLIYSDVTGLRYEESSDDFVLRVSSRIELRSQVDGSIRWESALGQAQDSCRRRRHDVYVNYVVELPDSLEPGAYRLRLVLTDWVAGRDASAETTLEIAR